MHIGPEKAAEMAGLLQCALPREGRAPGDIRVSWAPGRINILGEHTDYNDGYVLPAATTQGTLVAAAPRPDGLFRVHSEAFGQTAEFHLQQLRAPTETRDWAAYVRGVVWVMARGGVALPGLDAVISGDLPIGAGLASSAALEVAYALALLDAASAHMSPAALGLACQEAENQYVGVRCGILDQFASIFAHHGAASLIDCRQLRVDQVNFGADDCVFVVCDTTKARDLAASDEYNKRREQCDAAAEALGVEKLRDATMDELLRHRSRMPGVAFRRARHVVSENRRVLQGVEALGRGDFPKLGRLLCLTHESLRDDYEVSCTELDEMVRAACSTPGCLGARLIGAGFGGCVLAVVRVAEASAFCDAVKEAYTARTGKTGRTFITSPACGARMLTGRPVDRAAAADNGRTTSP